MPALPRTHVLINKKTIKGQRPPKQELMKNSQKCQEPTIDQTRNCKAAFQTTPKRYNQPMAMAQTTKLAKFELGSIDQLVKTKKPVPVSPKPTLTSLLEPRNFKYSVCSINEAEEAKERVQESQILVDYFHPNETRKNQISSFMNSRNITPTESLISRQKY